MARYLCSICNFHFAINALGRKISPLTNEVGEGKKCFQPFAKTSPANFSHYPNHFPYKWGFQTNQIVLGELTPALIFSAQVSRT